MGAPLSPRLLLSGAYLEFHGLPFSMEVGASLLLPHPSVAIHFSIWVGKGPGAFASFLLPSFSPPPPHLASSSALSILPPLLLFLSFAQPIPPLCLCPPSAVWLLGLVPSFLPALVLEIPRPCSLLGASIWSSQTIPCGMGLLLSCSWGSRTKKPFCWGLDSL